MTTSLINLKKLVRKRSIIDRCIHRIVLSPNMFRIVKIMNNLTIILFIIGIIAFIMSCQHKGNQSTQDILAKETTTKTSTEFTQSFH